MLKSLLPVDVEVNITNDDMRFKSDLMFKKQLGLLKNLFFSIQY